MQVQHEKFEVRTNGKGTYEITHEVQEKIDKSGVRNGVVTIFVQHTSCSLTMMENAAPAARRDVERFFEKLVPEDADYEHDDEGGQKGDLADEGNACTGQLLIGHRVEAKNARRACISPPATAIAKPTGGRRTTRTSNR